MHAAMALAGLEELDEQISRNRQRYLRYKQRLDKVPGLELIEFDESMGSGYKSIVVNIGDSWPLGRDETIALLNAEMILARSYYPDPLHRAPMRYQHISPELPITEALAQRFILLPCGEHVGLADVDLICDFIQFIFELADEILDRRQNVRVK
jgi:dTDP-4-amino-4,6-dideoxygalactose transaminase